MVEPSTMVHAEVEASIMLVLRGDLRVSVILVLVYIRFTASALASTP